MPACPVGSVSGSICISMFDVRCLMFDLQLSRILPLREPRRFSFFASPLGQGERTKVRGWSASIVFSTIILTLPSPFKGEATPCAGCTFDPLTAQTGKPKYRARESDFLIPTSERL